MPDISEDGQAVDQTEDEQNGRINPEGDACLPLLDLDESGPAYGSALRQNDGRNPPPPPRVADILPQLAQGTADRQRQVIRIGLFHSVHIGSH